MVNDDESRTLNDPENARVSHEDARRAVEEIIRLRQNARLEGLSLTELKNEGRP